MKKRSFIIVGVMLVAVMLFGVACGQQQKAGKDDSVNLNQENPLAGKTIVLDRSDLGFAISNDKVEDLKDQLVEKGYENSKFVAQLENGEPVVDSASGATILAYKGGSVYIEEGADIFDIDNTSIDVLTSGYMDTHDRSLVGIIPTDYAEIDYFE